MNVNNFNFFERHAEKITLAVVAAAAGYLIYITLPLMLPVPTSAGSESTVPADQVESEVTRAVETLDAAREETKRKEITVKVDDYIAKYNTMMKNQPLPEYLVEVRMPPFAPRNLAVDSSISTDQQHDVPVATPIVPMPTDLAAVTWRGVVLPVAPVPGAAPAPPVAPPAPGGPAVAGGVDKDLVLIKGVIDLSAMLKQMTDLPPAFQRTVICRIELQRRVRSANAWSDYKAVPQSPAVPPINIDWPKVGNADLQSTLNGLEAQLKQIAQPEYYPTPGGGSVVQQLLGGLPAPAAPAGAPAPAPAPAAAPGAPPAGPTPIWAFDDSVEPGAEYQYQMRVVMYNPTYRWPRALKDPAMKNEPTIASEWATVPNAVDVKANMYVFITKSGLAQANGPQVNANVYKYSVGHWYRANVNIQPGLPIVASIKMPGAQPIEVATGCTLVDVTSAPGGNEAVAVISDANGELSTRSTAIDGASDIKSALDQEINQSPPATRPGGLFPRPSTGSGTPSPAPAPGDTRGRAP